MKTPRAFFRFFPTVLFAALVAGCGFQMRGSYSLPYESIYLSGADYSPIISGLKRAIRTTNTRLSDTAKDAQATFISTGETRQPIILSLSSAGRVREKRLSYRYGYRVVDTAGRNLVTPSMIELNRDLTYSDSDALSKIQEEELLWQDMQKDAVEQLMRRLAAAESTTPENNVLD
ncbi:MAG: LPS assembly lipoprotein LptE [Candidatus Accumulibacter sp.]|jgi:LPS-assembly lipoprotein|nr:LPS assembly lipoprotein LptE [Accumulibacter sp.]